MAKKKAGISQGARTYYALKYSQRASSKAPIFYVFHAPAGDIVEWANVDRIDPKNPEGAQRPLRELKVAKVKKYFDARDDNTVPTAVIVALDQGCVTYKGVADGLPSGGFHGTLTIRNGKKEKAALIIDGQHRVYGAKAFSPSTELNVVAFVGGGEAAAERIERAFQFVVINNSTTRISKDHIKALNLNYDEEKLNDRLIKSAGLAFGIKDEDKEDLLVLDTSGPFKGLIKWPRNKNGFIPPNALEAALSEVKDRGALLGIESLERDAFLLLWEEVKKEFKDQWQSSEKSNLLMKVSIYAMTVFVMDALVNFKTVSPEPVDLADPKILRENINRLIKLFPNKLWSKKWAAKELDTASGREMVLRSFAQVASNVRQGKHWYGKVEIVNAGSLGD